VGPRNFRVADDAPNTERHMSRTFLNQVREAPFTRHKILCAGTHGVALTFQHSRRSLLESSPVCRSSRFGADCNFQVPQQPAITRPDGRNITSAQIDSTVNRLIQSAHVTGAGVALFYDGKVVYLKRYGVRDAEKDLPLTPDSVMTAACLPSRPSRLSSCALSNVARSISISRSRNTSANG
jgi:hypothetical protein